MNLSQLSPGRWKSSLLGLAIVALLAAFFNPPDWGVTSGEFEYVQQVVDGGTLMLGTGEHVGLIGVDAPESVRPNTSVQRLGKEAADFTRRMVEGKRVRLSTTKQMPLVAIKTTRNRNEPWRMCFWKTARC
jgi:endonuclease YncB( thermonuclease family)